MKCHRNNNRGRRSIRLQGYDYGAPGAYFVTVCSHRQACLFGEIREHQMILNGIGRIVERCWLAIPGHFPHIELDQYVVMPNHVHGILRISQPPVNSSRVHNTETKVGAEDFPPLQGNGQAIDLRNDNGTVGANNHSPIVQPCRTKRSWAEDFPPLQGNGQTNGLRNDNGIVGANNHSPVAESHRSNPPRAEDFPPLRGIARGTSKTIGSAIRGFKIGVTKWVRHNTPIYLVWQRNYYEHVIRNEESLMQIRQYIDENPLRWSEDAENPQAVKRRGE